MYKSIPRILLFVITILIGLIYLKSLNNPLVFDDHAYGHFLPSEQTITFSSSRSVSYGTFSEIGSLSDDLIYQRMFNLLLHIVNTILVYALCMRLLKDDLSAIFGALLFGLSPSAAFAVAYLMQRSIELVVFFGLLQLIFYHYAITSESVKDAIAYSVVSVACFYFVIHCKQQGIMLIAAYPAMSIAFRNKYSVGRWMTAISVILCAMAFLYFLKVGVAYADEDHGAYADVVMHACGYSGDMGHSSRVTQSYLFIKYIWMWINPFVERSIDMREPLRTNHFYPFAYLSWLAVGIALCIRRSAIGFAAVLIWFCFLPEVVSTRISEIFVLYRSYLYSIGYSIIAAYMFSRLGLRSSASAIIGCVALMFGGLTYRTLDQFDSEELVWAQASNILRNGDAAWCQSQRINNNYAEALIKKGKYGPADTALKNAMDISDYYGPPIVNRGTWCMMMGDSEQAAHHYYVALKNHDPVVRNAAQRMLDQLGGKKKEME